MSAISVFEWCLVANDSGYTQKKSCRDALTAPRHDLRYEISAPQPGLTDMAV